VTKTFVGPQLRQLRRERRQTQAEMAKVLGVSAGYVNLLENNERSLSLRILMALARPARRAAVVSCHSFFCAWTKQAM
jgi:XRE family transcriptional regulator, fatty acid utilization regulator